jgi:hypothetical protein
MRHWVQIFCNGGNLINSERLVFGDTFQIDCMRERSSSDDNDEHRKDRQ